MGRATHFLLFVKFMKSKSLLFLLLLFLEKRGIILCIDKFRSGGNNERNV